MSGRFPSDSDNATTPPDRTDSGDVFGLMDDRAQGDSSSRPRPLGRNADRLAKVALRAHQAVRSLLLWVESACVVYSKLGIDSRISPTIRIDFRTSAEIAANTAFHTVATTRTMVVRSVSISDDGRPSDSRMARFGFVEPGNDPSVVPSAKPGEMTGDLTDRQAWLTSVS